MLPIEEAPITLAEHADYQLLPKAITTPFLITDDHIGVEVELENAAHIQRGFIGWEAHRDGSLRNNGMEFIFDGPVGGKEAYDRLINFQQIIENPLVNRGVMPICAVRSSVHVHVNVNDLTPQQIGSMLGLYIVFETPIFKTFAPERAAGNHFCRPFKDCLEMSQVFYWLKRDWSTFENNINSPRIGRYCALNLKAMFKFGSIEFRHHGGEWRSDKLIQWINTCLSFKRAAHLNINFVNDFFKNSAIGYEGSLRQYFPRDVVDRVLAHYKNDINALNKDVAVGVVALQNLVLPRIRI